MRAVLVGMLLLLLAAGSTAAPVAAPVPAAAADGAEAVPSGRLPRTALPRHYALRLRVDPARRTLRRRGSCACSSRPPPTTWLHGKHLDVRRVTVVDAGPERTARWRSADPAAGWRAWTSGATLPAQARCACASSTARRGSRQLEGLYKAENAGKAYIVSQMEAISARAGLSLPRRALVRRPST